MVVQALSADATDQAEVEASFDAAKAAFDGVAPNIVVSTVGGGGVTPNGEPRNQGGSSYRNTSRALCHDPKKVYEQTPRLSENPPPPQPLT